jgi:hypothetical protein
LEINDINLNEIEREETVIEHTLPISMYLIVDNRKTLFCASKNDTKLYYLKHIIDDYYDESFIMAQVNDLKHKIYCFIEFK